MLEITLHEDADEEFKAAIMFYESRQPGLGDIFLQRITEGFECVLDNPRAGKILFADIHRHLIDQFHTP
jgi:hypothetical protein